MEPLKKLLDAHRKFTKERDWDKFQSPKNLAMALSVEAAELVEIFTWLSEKQSSSLNKEKLEAVSDELADIFIYLLRLSDTLGIDLLAAADQKMEKNGKKYSVEKGIELAKALNALG